MSQNTPETVRLAGESPSARLIGSAPLWYTESEMYHWLILREYAPSIARELAKDYARHLQAAFDKGFEIGNRQAQNAAGEPYPI